METNTDRQLVFDRLPEEIVAEIKKKLSRWYRVMNHVIGVMSFTLALGCLGTHHSQIYAAVSLAFIFALLVILSRYSPLVIEEFRKKPNKTDLEEVFLKGVEAHFLGVRKTFKETPLYWIGFLFLIAVMIGLDDKLSMLMKNIGNYLHLP